MNVVYPAGGCDVTGVEHKKITTSKSAILSLFLRVQGAIKCNIIRSSSVEKGGVNRGRNGGVALSSTVFAAEVSTAGGVIYLLVIYSTFYSTRSWYTRSREELNLLSRTNFRVYRVSVKPR